MEVKGRKFLVLYLTDWQTRMVKDFLGVDCHYWTVPIEGSTNTRYGVGAPSRRNVKLMYLTDWQKREIEAEAGEKCDYIELEPNIITKYGIPPEKF